MKSLGIDRPTLDDPMYDQKNPHQTFLLLLSIVSATPLLLGHSSGSATLDRALPQGIILLWGACLFVGSIIALAGEFWRGHTWDGLVLERSGLALVGGGAALYAYVVFISTPDSQARFTVAITLAYALSCGWRVVQITRRLRWIRGVIEEMNSRHAQ